jgi:hypothetical protein
VLLVTQLTEIVLTFLLRLDAIKMNPPVLEVTFPLTGELLMAFSYHDCLPTVLALVLLPGYRVRHVSEVCAHYQFRGQGRKFRQHGSQKHDR